MFARCTCRLLRVKHNFSSYKPPQHIKVLVQTKPPSVCVRIFHQKTPGEHHPSTAAFEGTVGKVWRSLFGKYLFATNVISSAVLMVVGDMCAQIIEMHGREGSHFDYPRIWRMFIVGAAQGPLHHWVYAWMDRVMPVPTMSNIMKKILIDQIFMSPACILLFYYTACYLEKKCLKETHAEIVSKFPIIYAFDWLLWPGAQYVNFRYLEPKYRVFFVNVCTALYDIFISYIKHEDDVAAPIGATIQTASNPDTEQFKNNVSSKTQTEHHTREREMPVGPK